MVASIATLVGRALIGGHFLFAAFAGLVTPRPQIARLAEAGLPFAPAFFWACLPLQALCAILVILGARARAAAWVLAVVVFAVNGFLAYQAAPPPTAAHLLRDFAAAGGLLLLAAAGPGAFSLDRR